MQNDRDNDDPADLKPIVVHDPAGLTCNIYVGPVASFAVRLGKHGGRRDSLRVRVVRDDASTFEAGVSDLGQMPSARRQAQAVAAAIAGGQPFPGQDQPLNSDSGRIQFGVTLGGSLAVSVTLLVLASHVTATPGHVALVVLGAIASLFTLYLLATVAFVGLVAWMIDEYSKPRRKRFWTFRHWPFWVWPIVVLLALTWPPYAALSGYSASEWLWQGVSICGGAIALLAVFFRRRADR